MWNIAFALLLIVIAVLSRQGLIRRHPLTGKTLDNIHGIVLQREFASLLMIPAIVPLIQQFPAWGHFTPASLVSLLVITVAVPVLTGLITARDTNETHREYFAGLHFGSRFWIQYLIATCFYMVMYEILLRGILLHYFTGRMSVLYAVALNTIIYAVMHLVKNRQEALLSIPLGILLCWLAIYTQSIWPAAGLHLIMSLSFEFYYSTNKKIR